MSNPTTILIIRHGDVVYPTDSLGRKLLYGTDAPLTETGVRQIHELALLLQERNFQFDKIYTSPYLRARQTADVLVQDLGVETLLERGELEDIRHSLAGSLWEDVMKANLGSFDETHEQLADRMWQVFQEIRSSEEGNTVGIVSHGDPIRVLLYRLVEGWGPLPPIAELNKYDYLNKGEAWNLLLSKDGSLMDREFITTRERRSLRRERED